MRRLTLRASQRWRRMRTGRRSRAHVHNDDDDDDNRGDAARPSGEEAGQPEPAAPALGRVGLDAPSADERLDELCAPPTTVFDGTACTWTKMGSDFEMTWGMAPAWSRE